MYIFPVPEWGRVPGEEHPCFRDAVLINLIGVKFLDGNVNFLPFNGGAGRDIPKIPEHFLVYDIRVDIACYCQHGICRAIIGFKPLVYIFQGGRIEVFHFPDYRPGIGMSLGVHRPGEVIPLHAIWLVLPLPLFILDHPALFVEFFLVDGPQQVAHPIRFEEEYLIQGTCRDVLEIICPVTVGGSVQVGSPDTFQGLEVIVVEVLTPVEHQVFEQMRKTTLPGFFIFRADVVPDVHSDDGRLVIFVDKKRQAVRQYKFLIGYFNVGCLEGYFLGRAPMCSNEADQQKQGPFHGTRFSD